ncbi:MAG: glycoside hydrolase family 16 protein [Hellea sp.]|nr:glycoside hydrolase family 16 protein [Hellea sp.]
MIVKALASTVLVLAVSFGLSNLATAQDADVPAVDLDKWNLVWADEFEGQIIDPDKWTHETDCWGGGNEERQCYTDEPENSFVSDGTLKITALKKRTTGHALPASMRKTRDLAKQSKTQPYSSARLRTFANGDWRFGRFDIRAKLPGGQGVWPAIWMLPSDQHYGTWALSGELDIMEAINLGAPCDECEGGVETRVHGTLHYGGQWPDNKHSGSETTLDDIAAWHTYSIVWSAGVISWYVDGEQFARQTMDDWYSDSKDAEGRILAPFDQRFHMLLNVAIGGEWPERNGNGVDKTGFPKTMEVDFVRVYECASDPELGLDCISL